MIGAWTHITNEVQTIIRWVSEVQGNQMHRLRSSGRLRRGRIINRSSLSQTKASLLPSMVIYRQSLESLDPTELLKGRFQSSESMIRVQD